jgi:hypothetical protein
MARVRTTAESAAGKVISAIQRVWTHRLGTDQASEAESVMNRAHDLLTATRNGQSEPVLAGRTVRDFLGSDWVSCHPGVERAVAEFQASLDVV